MLIDSKVSVACFTESRLSDSIPDRAIAIPGFRIVRNDRGYKRGGGIALYVGDYIQYRTVYSSVVVASSSCKTECLAVELTVNQTSILLIAMNNPPGSCAVY